MTRPMTVILCEGYHDRAFLAGLLVGHLGWTEPGLRPDGSRLPYKDEWGVVSGDFGYCHPSANRDLRVRPCDGDRKVPKALANIIKQGRTFDRLVLCYDGDKGGRGPDFLTRVHQSVEGLLVNNGLHPTLVDPGRWTCQSLCREALALVWHCGDPIVSGVPEQQCLERLVCASAAKVWPDRVQSLGGWLSQRPSPTHTISGDQNDIPKSNALALVGGWFAEHGYEGFLKSAWSHPQMAAALRARLEASGAWAVLESLSQPIP